MNTQQIEIETQNGQKIIDSVEESFEEEDSEDSANIISAKEAFLYETTKILRLQKLTNYMSPRTFFQQADVNLDSPAVSNRSYCSTPHPHIMDHLTLDKENDEENDPFRQNQEENLEKNADNNKTEDDNLNLSVLSDSDPADETNDAPAVDNPAFTKTGSKFRIAERLKNPGHKFSKCAHQTQQQQQVPSALILSMDNKINRLKRKINSLEKENSKLVERANKFRQQAALSSYGITFHKKRSGGTSPKLLQSLDKQLRNSYLVPIIVRKPTIQDSKEQKDTDDFFDDSNTSDNSGQIKMPPIDKHHWREITKICQTQVQRVVLSNSCKRRTQTQETVLSSSSIGINDSQSQNYNFSQFA